MKRKALGRGLSALLPDLPEQTRPETPYQEVLLDRIIENELQPRESFDEESLECLAESIRQHGVLQPIIVRRDPVGPDTFQVVAGERRLRAARLAGLQRIPAMIVDAEDARTLELALVENLQRSDLNPIEEAHAYRHLIKDFGMTQDGVAGRVGKSREAVSNALRLLSLPDKVKHLVRDGSLSAGHARALVGVSPPSRAVSLAERIVSEGLSVREVERLVAREKPAARAKKPPAVQKDPYLRNLESLFQERLQTKVRIIRGKSGKGRIEIDFYDNSQLNSLLERLHIRLDS